jgi:hypothetical protein
MNQQRGQPESADSRRMQPHHPLSVSLLGQREGESAVDPCCASRVRAGFAGGKVLADLERSFIWLSASVSNIAPYDR